MAEGPSAVGGTGLQLWVGPYLAGLKPRLPRTSGATGAGVPGGVCRAERNTRGQSWAISVTEEDRAGRAINLFSRIQEQLLFSKQCSQNCGYSVNRAEKGLEAGEVNCCIVHGIGVCRDGLLGASRPQWQRKWRGDSLAREPPGSCRAEEERGHSMCCQLAVNTAQPHSP